MPDPNNGAVEDWPWLVTSDETGGLLVWDPVLGDLLQRLPAEGMTLLAAHGGQLLTFGDGRSSPGAPTGAGSPSPASGGDLDAFARCASPWRLAGSALAAAPPLAQGCAIAP